MYPNFTFLDHQPRLSLRTTRFRPLFRPALTDLHLRGKYFSMILIVLLIDFILQRGNQGDINKFWIIFLICCYIAVFVDWGIEVFDHPLPNATDTFLIMGYAKAAITFVKYLPQVYLNWSRQSCDGWSFENVILDFMGGSLSFL